MFNFTFLHIVNEKNLKLRIIKREKHLIDMINLNIHFTKKSKKDLLIVLRLNKKKYFNH